MNTHEQNLLNAVLGFNAAFTYAIYSGGFARAREADWEDREQRKQWNLSHPAYDPRVQIGVAPVKQGTRVLSGGETLYTWALYRRSDLSTENPMDDAIEQTGWYCYDSGPGRPFGSAPWAREYRRYILVMQQRGLDI